ncbi:hypothetical protein JQV27_12315 [Sulfitobacter mediterraneus]|uniref:DUF6497 family protein n=1 Tax=Sulfitobacter mediterraneus TaxID=83219 RepID=UPI001932F7EC|nr:DUF6497 family protein [Sulfitobacter mediterraneus]MBM1634067.1 hypothetical protein [Sulfitobacter mediterraneus]MBM1641418.1 hypothetical protein [Sulfitobacter mediterraneus]MBM1645932.1 hypothetical protein [Sulfitobacter mediterraneus]MBM1649537.1 hypothetical protein [Sulfitobacter mediterraneus]MBM1654000.1 hypothetical protein [Sulfitobacter mediterraneus]
MIRLAFALLLAATPVWSFDVPSGQPVDLQEVLIDDLGDEVWLRFRFVAPKISRDDAMAEANAQDMLHLCEVTALSYISDFELSGDVIVVSLADRPTEFGVADPDATQFFEAFRAENGSCIWEGF